MDQQHDCHDGDADEQPQTPGNRAYDKLPPGHPLDTFLRENTAIREQVRQVRAALAEFHQQPDDSQLAAVLPGIRQAAHNLLDIEKHFLRKEGLLFPALERHGITGPSTVMWGRDDDAREHVRAMERCLSSIDIDSSQFTDLAETTIEPALKEIERMVEQEERKLLPMAWETLREDDWGEIWRNSPQFGWCLVGPREGYEPPAPSSVAEDNESATRDVVFPTGSLTPKQMQAMFATLPLDFTFVDADDRVRFFSLGPEPVFARSKVDLGRKVQECHLPQSVAWLDRILADFRAGRLNVVDSWIHHENRFVHVRYFAVRDQANSYLGTLEMVQDISPIQRLEGECRLAQYADYPRPESLE